MAMQETGAAAACRECGGTLTWDPAAGRLRCASCGAVRDPAIVGAQAAAGTDAPAAASLDDDGQGLGEHDLAEALARVKPRWQLGAGARQVRCQECAAVVEFPDGVTATRCSFCDSPSVLAQDARGDLIAPESLIPFVVNRDDALQRFRTWLGRLWFRPFDLRDKATVSELRGVYVPYWTFDCDVTSSWTADAGYHYYVNESHTVQENGRSVQRTRRVQRTRWEPASGTRHDSFDDLLVCASKGLPDALVHRLEDFDTGALVAYAPDYLRGFSAESYAVELRDGWKLGRDRMAGAQLRRCAGDVPGDTHRNLHASHRYANATFKHVLLPVWVAAFRYHDQVYRFLVNGQTGKVAGKAPLSAAKILGFVAILVVIAVTLWLALTRQ